MVEKFGVSGSGDRLKTSFGGNRSEGGNGLERGPWGHATPAQQEKKAPVSPTDTALFSEGSDSSQDGSWSSTSPSERIEL